LIIFYTNDYTSETISGTSVNDMSDHLQMFIIIKLIESHEAFLTCTKLRNMSSFKADDLL